MSGEPKDSAIKLFGKTIPLPEIPPRIEETTSALFQEDINRDTEERQDEKETSEDGPRSSSTAEDSINPDEEEASAPEASTIEEETSETSESKDKSPKKPDNILPCPRCKSAETKFCYYNNYNANQPRHFCKDCQRYWTAGGTMRNVPVGAGRRKTKNSTSHQCHITVSEAQYVNHNGAVLAFCPDSIPLRESGLKIEEKTMRNGVKDVVVDGKSTGSPLPHQIQFQYWTSGDSRFDRLIQYYPGAPWPYLSPDPPPLYAPGFTVPLYSAYLGCGVPGPPLPDSPTLGKHPRDEQTLKSSSSGKDEAGPKKADNAEKCFWVPKAMRFDDPGDAAKSSMWASLGIRKDTGDSVMSRNCVAEASHISRANPAALSRSLNFRENS